ncbi:hypothetical protein [Rhodovulum strictum]|uniref:Uncharacterized protein n=2 Tax=Rhodovulum strictum TaxID=58314 RepID=A0A844BPV6_9RHOB|nr:hypothetical protein [Rhodovulum strictum]
MSLGVPGRANPRPTGRADSMSFLGLAHLAWREVLCDVGQHRGPNAFVKTGELLRRKWCWGLGPAPKPCGKLLCKRK